MCVTSSIYLTHTQISLAYYHICYLDVISILYKEGKKNSMLVYVLKYNFY